MKSLHKVLDIIDRVAEMGNAGIREISLSTGFPPTTVHRIASTLAERGYFKQDSVSKNYSLSFKFLELGTTVQQKTSLVSIARPHLEKLMAVTKESANLAVQERNEVVYLDHVQSDYAMLRLFTRLGARVPMYATGVGKMFMSRWSLGELDEYLSRTRLIPYTSHTLVKREKILEELTRIQSEGYAVDNEEMEDGVRCVADLIFEHTGKIAGAVSISGAAMRIAPEQFEYFGKEVKSIALAISRDLGFKPEG